MRFSSSATGCSDSRKVVFTGSVFYGNWVERAPEVPGGHRAPRAPGLAQPFHGSQGNLALPEVGMADPFPQSEIVQRENIRAQQIEHQEHLGRPAPDAPHLDQLGNDRLVVHARPFVHVDLAVYEVLREVGDVLDLTVGEAAGAQQLSVFRYDFLGSYFFKTKTEPVPYALRGLDRDLLAADRPGKRKERLAALHHEDLRMRAHDPRHNRIFPR